MGIRCSDVKMSLQWKTQWNEEGNRKEEWMKRFWYYPVSSHFCLPNLFSLYIVFFPYLTSMISQHHFSSSTFSFFFEHITPTPISHYIRSHHTISCPSSLLTSLLSFLPADRKAFYAVATLLIDPTSIPPDGEKLNSKNFEAYVPESKRAILEKLKEYVLRWIEMYLLLSVVLHYYAPCCIVLYTDFASPSLRLTENTSG